MGPCRLAGTKRWSSDGGANGGNGAGDSVRGSDSESWGGARERLGLALRASLGMGGPEDVGRAQQCEGANGGSGRRGSLERGAVRSGRKPRSDA